MYFDKRENTLRDKEGYSEVKKKNNQHYRTWQTMLMSSLYDLFFQTNGRGTCLAPLWMPALHLRACSES